MGADECGFIPCSMRCWFAPEDEIEPTIDVAIRSRDKLLLILSETAMGSAEVSDHGIEPMLKWNAPLAPS